MELPQFRHAIDEVHNKSDWKEMKKVQVHKFHGSCCLYGLA
ncbi:hypothetical protein [Coxiella-like endosymbiont]|nr:hypothetical protein [Coxiella-like endosymbiont]